MFNPLKPPSGWPTQGPALVNLLSENETMRSLPHLSLLTLTSLIAACHTDQGMNKTPDASSHDHHDQWVQAREDALRNPEGWLTLVGLVWLEPGSKVLGRDDQAGIAFEGAPASPSGTFDTTKEGRVSFTLSPGVTATINGEPIESDRPIPLRNDVGGPSDILRLGTLHITNLQRQNQPVLRVRDHEAETLRNFNGLTRYPFNAKWIVPARFEPAPAGTTQDVEDVTGHISQESRAGTLNFQLDGTPCRLHATAAGKEALFVVFGDETNGDETYGGGRFLNVTPPDEHGMTTIDFNRAYIPPCSFTPFATCPIPDNDNRLQIPITAGEQNASSPTPENSR